MGGGRGGGLPLGTGRSGEINKGYFIGEKRVKSHCTIPISIFHFHLSTLSHYSLVIHNKLRYPLRNPKIELQILNFITEHKK